MTKNKKWVKPQLTVLTRTKPEELILLGCKSAWDGGSSSDWMSMCDWESYCTACSDTGGS